MIAAVVVTYSAGPEVLDRCLRSVLRAGGVDHLVVVDTGGVATFAHDLADRCELVRTGNRGYGAAANTGVEVARRVGAERVALLNDDVVVEPGWLAPLLDELVDEVGAAQPMLVTSDGSVASLGVELDRYGAGHDIGDGRSRPVVTTPADIDVFTGGAVVFTTAFLDATGGFDERLFMYYEDVDLARRGRRLGWRYRVVPQSVVEHDRGTTTGALGDRTRFQQERNRLWTAFRFAGPVEVGRAVWLSVRRVRHEPRSVHVRALVAGLTGAPTRLVDRARGRDCVNP